MRRTREWKPNLLVTAMSLIFFLILPATGPLWAAIPNTPSDLTATPLSYTQIKLTWTDNSTDETYFYIERKIGATGTYAYLTYVGANITTYTDAGLAQNTVYYYRVRAYNASGYSAYSNEASSTTVIFPPPSNLTATAVSSKQINLTWTDNSSDETYFYIEYKTTGNFTYLTSVPSNTTTYTHTNLTQGTTFTYRVRAYNSSSYVYSAYSSEASATTLPLNAPSNVSAAPISSTQINLTWTDNSNDETYFYIERKTGATGTYSQIAYVGANVTTYSNTGLSVNTQYYYRVRAYNGVSYSDYSEEASASTPPINAPSSLAASVVSFSQVNLTWTDNSNDELYFYIERKTGAGGTYSQIGSVGANVKTYSSTGLSPNTEYYYRVRAYNYGGYSEYSNEINVTTPPFNPPSDLTATAVSSDKINLTWTDNTSDETYFYIERKTGASGSYSQIGSVGANVTAYSSTGLTQNTEYYYRIRAYNAGGYSAYSNEANATTAVFNPPSNLTATPLSSSQIKLTWTDNSNDETYFYIEYKTTGNYTTLTSVAANTTTYTHTNLPQNTTYYYRIRAYNSGGYSSYSNEVSGTTATLNAPTNVSISAASYTQVTLTWTDNSSDETNFYIERKTGAGGTYTQVGSVGANVTTYTNTGLTQGTEYYYRVRAYNGSTNYSAYSNEINITTLRVNAPSDLRATPVSAVQIQLDWTDNSNDESGFKIERKIGAGGSYSLLVNLGANVTTYTNTGLTQNTDYYYRVYAYNSSSTSEFSNEAHATTTPLNAPSNLSASAVSYKQVTLTWTDNSTEETGFEIYQKIGAGGTYTKIYTTSANATSYTNTGLTQGTEYFYQVRAISGSNYSAYSNEVRVATPTLPAPSNLTATPLSSSQIQLAWTNNSSDVNRFYIEYKTTGDFIQLTNVSASTTTYTHSNLAQGTTYTYRVKAYSTSNNIYSAYSDEVIATTPVLPPPSALTATALSSTQIQLGWTDNSTDETNFYIERKTGAGGTYSQITSVGANVTTYADTGLTQNTAYYYRVRAYNSSNAAYSAYSNEISATTATLNAPSNLTTATLSYLQIKLTWTDNSSDEQYFYIERKAGASGTYSHVASVSANITTYTDSSVLPNTEYYYRVRAYNGSGYSAYSNEAGATPLSLNAPSNLTASKLSSSQIKLTWTDNSSDEQYFYIERKVGATGTYSTLTSVSANITTYTDYYLQPGTEYYYRVRAYNGSVYSAYSNEVSMTTQTLNAPSSLTAAALSSSQIKLTWTDNSSDETYFIIERKIGASGIYYERAWVSANTTTYTDYNSAPNTEYYYRLRAYNGGGYSAYSNEVSATTLTLNAPSSLTAAALSSSQMRLTWADNSSDEQYFYIERKVGATGAYSTLTSVGANVTTYTDSSVADNTEYYYRVRAYNGGGYSAYSNEAGAKTPILPLNAPSNLTAAALPSCEIRLTWADNSGETNFYIERKIGASGAYSTLTSVGANVTTYTDSSVAENTEYYYRVRAYNTAGYSAYSNEAGATTPIMSLRAPSNLTAAALSTSQIRLTWTDNSAEEQYFYIERKTGASGTYSTLTSVGANVTTYTDYCLQPNTEYYYRVRAYNTAGYSAYSNEAGATTLPLNAPSNLTATALSSSQVKLTWTDNSTEEIRFYIERKTGASGTYAELPHYYYLGANTTTYTDYDLSQNTQYYYRVRAYNCGGYSPYSNEAAATTPVLNLYAPNLTVTPTFCGIELTWTHNSSEEQYFYIERKTGASGTYSYLTYAWANTTTYTDTSALQNTEYYYRVRAYGAGVYSPYSNEVSATTLTLNAPSNLTATALSYSQIKLTWTDNSSDEWYFIIERKEGASGTYSYLTGVWANTTTYIDTSALQNTEYYYRVRAYNCGGYSAYSNEAVAATPPLNLNAPSNLTASALSSSQIKLTWSDNSSDEQYFYIERKTGASGTYAELPHYYYLGANTTTYTDYDLAQNTEYYYRVRAYGAGIYSAYSNEAGATTLPVNAPSDLTAEPISCSEIKLTWKDNSTDEWYFSIEYKKEGDAYWSQTYVYGNTTTYTHTGLVPGKKYYYRVRAYSYPNYSPYSNEASGTTIMPEGYERYSQKIALVPNAVGRYNNGGTLPTSFNCYAPTFVNVSVESIRDNSTDPLVSGGYDTVVLAEICDVDNFLSNNQFKTRIENFVSNGGKLIIWDSECQNTDYSKFVFPFTTSNPGQMGSTGVLNDVEENTLSSKITLSDNYINVSYISAQTDAVGDANVLVTQDPNWCIDMTAQNYYGVTGAVHTYAQYGKGLIIYDGLDKDVLYTGQTIGTADGIQNLGKTWMLELKQAWNPVPIDPQTGKSVLPCLVPVVGIQLSPETATTPVNKYHTLTAKVVDQLGNPLAGITVTFTVKSGPHAGTGGTGVTDSSGIATFSYKGIYAGTDSIEASAAVSGSIVKSKTVKNEWILALTDVRVVDTISNAHITVDELSISPTPYRVSQAGSSIEIEWRYTYISIGQIQDISLYVNLLNPIPGEDRLVNQKLTVYYMDVNGNPVTAELGPQYVHVLNSAFDGSISTDKPEYQPNENVVISASIKSLSEYTKTIDAKVLVEDGNGALVKEVAALTALNFSAGETKSFNNLVFNAGSTYAGNYKAHLILYDNQKQTAEAFANFAILPAKAATSSVITDKTAYAANEPVTITSQIRNASLNYIFHNLTAKISLFDNQGRVLFTDSKTIPVLTLGELSAFNTYWNTLTNPKGKYTVTLEVFEGASVVSTSQTLFDILGTSQTGVGLVGTIAAQPNPVYRGKSETLTYSIKNIGNEDITNLAAKVLVVDPDTGEIKHTFESTINLNMAGMISGRFIASTLNMSPKTYVVLLQASTSAMKQKTLASTTFAVKSPMESIRGIITANPNPVFQGRDEILFYRVTNAGNEDIANLKIIVPVIDPDTQAVKATFETMVNIQANATVTGNFTFATAAVTPKTYIAELRVSIPEMTQTRTLSSTTFEVKASLKITKTIPDIKRVLVWLNYQWQSGQNCPERSLIEQALNEAGITYHIVVDKKDFDTELRNPYYTDFMILGGQYPIEDSFSEELREQVYSGKGLVSSMFYRQNLNEEVFGIRLINYLSDRDYPIELLESDVSTAGSFQSSGRALNVDALNPEENIGWIVETTKKGINKYPGIVKHEYGLGKVLFFTFDLGMSSADYSQFANIIKNSLNYIHKPLETTFQPDQLIPVEIKVQSLGGVFDLRITETYPSELKLYDPSTDQWITDDPWIINTQLSPNETKTILYYALSPDKAGTYTLQTEVGYMEGGNYNFYQNLKLEISINKDAVILSNDIISALNALSVSEKDREKLGNTILYIKNVQNRIIISEQNIEENIHDILKAIDSLLFITSADTSTVMLMIDDLLMTWESRYYLRLI